jgi:hypothetical protein
MDPNVVWQELLDAAVRNDMGEAFPLADSLLMWLQRGGCLPDKAGTMTRDEFRAVVRMMYSCSLENK